LQTHIQRLLQPFRQAVCWCRCKSEAPKEVASVVAFVASTQAVAINGAAVRAEGGVIRSIF
jgi:hypothetical protein